MTPGVKIRRLIILILFLSGQFASLNLFAQDFKVEKGCAKDILKYCDLAVLDDDSGDDPASCIDAVILFYGAENFIQYLEGQQPSKEWRTSHKWTLSPGKLYAKYRVYRI